MDGSSFKLKGHLAMLAANCMWGLMSPVVKLVMTAGAVTPLLMTSFRIYGAALLFWLTSAFFKYERVPKHDLLLLAGAAMLGILFNQGCFISGVGLTSPGEASLITTTMPMWVMLLAWLILKEPITGKKILGIILGATGALLLVWCGSSGKTIRGNNPLAGDLLVLTAQLSYALYLTLYKNFITKYSLITLMKWMFLFAAIALTPFSLETITSTDWSVIPDIHYAGILYVIACGTFLSYICIMIGQKNLRPTVVGMYNYVQPIIASLVGVYLGLDKFTPVKILSVIMIFAGVFLVTGNRSRTNLISDRPR